MAAQAQTEIIPEIQEGAFIPMTPAIPDSEIASATIAVPKPAAKPKKKLVRRTDRDYSQVTRKSFQAAFLLLNVWIGTLFYFWVKQFEPGGAATSLQRPAGVEGWLPIAGLMNLRYLALSRHVPTLHPAGMFLLITFLSISFLFRKAFCSWLCPVGTISEYLWRAGRKIFRRNFHLPRWLDVTLRGLKYLLLGFFAWAVGSMGVEELSSFMHSPYGIIADVKMLNFFRHIGETGAIVLGVLVVASLLIQNFWCRFLCPYGALLGLVALASPTRIRRNVESCIDCSKCAKACPSALPVDKLVTIKSAECTGCLECVAVCPAKDTLSFALPNLVLPGHGPASRSAQTAGEDAHPHPAGIAVPARVPVWAMAAAIAGIFVGVVGFAKTSGYWDSHVPRAVYQQLVPNADQARHSTPSEEN